MTSLSWAKIWNFANYKFLQCDLMRFGRLVITKFSAPWTWSLTQGPTILWCTFPHFPFRYMFSCHITSKRQKDAVSTVQLHLTSLVSTPKGGSPMSRLVGTHVTSLDHFYHSVPWAHRARIIPDSFLSLLTLTAPHTGGALGKGLSDNSRWDNVGQWWPSKYPRWYSEPWK